VFGTKLGHSRPQPLKPFVLRTRDGYLLGLAQDPEKGAPCARCTELWLTDRNVWAERIELSQMIVRRELIPELLAENCAHVFFEISNDGTHTRLDTLVFPHPACSCSRYNYIAPKQISKNTNFAFSPITQLRVARFGTPDGNLWLATATGQSPVAKAALTTYGVERDKDLARFKAVDEWMKRATLADLPGRMDRGETLASEVLQTGNVELITKMQIRHSSFEGMGIGGSRDEATLDGLIHLARLRTLRKYSASMKNPMLVVGANNWIRTKVPFFLLQQYDLHLLFYPNSTQAWVVGMIALSRLNTSEKPVFVFSSDSDMGKAIDKLFFKLLETLRPAEDELFTNRIHENTQQNPKLSLWWTHWIYRCPKISLKDLLHLEPYARSLESWREYFRDGQDLVSVVAVNSEYFPSQVRTLVKLQVASGENVQAARNINGIGIWRDFADALA
jgi:hypothetical protein